MSGVCRERLTDLKINAHLLQYTTCTVDTEEIQLQKFICAYEIHSLIAKLEEQGRHPEGKFETPFKSEYKKVYKYGSISIRLCIARLCNFEWERL